MKAIIGVYGSVSSHWVGDGFPVKSLFFYDHLGEHISPFLLLDHAGPAQFTPTTKKRGVGVHPHRGFEPVTIVYDGEVAHGDSVGNRGVIGAGDVQWMTAARGILHEEYHSDQFAKQGGTLHMVQLWVNLPAQIKMSAPRYQAITNADISRISLPNDGGLLRVIAGEYQSIQGAAKTYSAINVWDVQLNAHKEVFLQSPASHNTILVILQGTVTINDEQSFDANKVVLFAKNDEQIKLVAHDDAKVLLLTGEPLNEPIVGQGPFVMNTQAEIRQAFTDYREGRLGT
jgi:hypothetical protein